MFIEHSMCFVIRRGVTPLERLRDSRGGQKPSSFFVWNHWILKTCCFSTMEESEIGVVRLLRDEICHRWWRARFSDEPRFFGKSGGYPWTFISDSKRDSI